MYCIIYYLGQNQNETVAVSDTSTSTSRANANQPTASSAPSTSTLNSNSAAQAQAPVSNSASAAHACSNSPAQVGADLVELKFLFANFDGISVLFRVPLSNTANQVKLKLLARWPNNVETISDGRRLRLLCMGKELNTSSDIKVTLKEMNIPRFQLHPTPVNVSILPAGIDPLKTKSGIKMTGKRGNLPPLPSSRACCSIQ
mmetsp:Transcript_16918/g.20322  ORF Transcript_16918/g.20322 Transcript_16918/m.20322 type:complete len:201 (+) Transcript_16918:1042-1644(+)